MVSMMCDADLYMPLIAFIFIASKIILPKSNSSLIFLIGDANTLILNLGQSRLISLGSIWVSGYSRLTAASLAGTDPSRIRRNHSSLF